MSISDQDDVDALLGSLDESSDLQGGIDSLVSEEDHMTDVASTPQDTAELETIQGKDHATVITQSSDNMEENPDLTPWVDFVPKDKRQKPKNVLEHIERSLEDGNFRLSEVEKLKLSTIYGGIHEEYLRLWVSESNMEFKRLVVLKNRLKILQQLPQFKKADKKAS